MKDKKHKRIDHSGTSFDSFLDEQGIREEVEAEAEKRVHAWNKSRRARWILPIFLIATLSWYVLYYRACDHQRNEIMLEFARAELLEKTGAYQGAEEAYRTSLKNASEMRRSFKIQPTENIFADIHWGLARVLSKQGKTDAAAAEFREVLRIYPENSMAHSQLASVLEASGNLDGALAVLREGMTLERSEGLNSPESHYRVGKILEKKNDLDSALKEYHEAHSLEPENLEFFESYVRVYRKSHQ
jgi:tetratricopeptide (TPR) repeat protein